MIRLPLETERLVIRPFEPELDAGPLHELWGDAEAMQFIPGGAKESVDWEGPELELAYHVVPSAWNRGYASEAAAALLKAAWDDGLGQVVAVAMPGNAASRRVMEKVGMSLEGSTRYRELDVVRYSILRPA